MAVKFTLGDTPAGSVGTRQCAIRRDEAAIRSGDHMNMDWPAWTHDVWVRPEAWARSGAATLPLSIVCGNNFEILASNPSGSTLRLVGTFRVQDASEAEMTGTTGNMDIASSIGTTWHLLSVQFNLTTGQACVWWDGVVKGVATGLTSPINRVFVKRKYVGLLANTSGADVFVDPAPTAAGVVSLDNWRVSKSARYTHNADFTPPSAQFTDTGEPAYGLYPLREQSTPKVILSSFGQYNGVRGRIDSFGDRYAGPWSMVVNATPNPVP